jgi:DNA-binding response OmpR family regulator
MLQPLVLASPTDVETVDILLTNAGWSTRRIGGSFPKDVLPLRSIERQVLLVGVDLLAAAEQVREIRRNDVGSRIRIILAAVRPTDVVLRQAILRALREGADDFVNVSALRTELGLRLEALVQRDQQRASRRVRGIYGMKLERGSRRLWQGERSVVLTRCECRLLLCLASHAGNPVARGLIGQRLRRDSEPAGGNFVDVYVAYLRRKLAELNSPCEIRTVRRVGYVLTAEPRLAAV